MSESQTMKSELQSWKSINRFKAYIVIICIFAIDTMLGNVYKVIGSENYVQSVYHYCSFKELFSLTPYLLLIAISQGFNLEFDKYDLALLFTCLLLQLFNCADFFINRNWRPMGADFVIVGIMIASTLYFKISHYWEK